MATSMTVVPAPAAMAFETAAATTPATSISAAAGGDPLTMLLSGILAGLSALDSTSSAVAAQNQTAAGQLGATQVQSYVDRDEAGAQTLRDPGVINC